MKLRSLLLGAVLASVARAALPRLLMLKFAPSVAKLNAGDHSALLDAYSDDIVLHFHRGPHRWSGDWVGKPEMDRFLQMFTASRIEGELVAITTSGPLWALTMWVRFDDHADAPDGTRLYTNSTVLLLRTRWGKVVEQRDFYVDTQAIVDFDRELAERGVEPVAATSS
jgi:ketosteroid isomerase-like protein